jgi:hypothetical protein
VAVAAVVGEVSVRALGTWMLSSARSSSSSSVQPPPSATRAPPVVWHYRLHHQRRLTYTATVPRLSAWEQRMHPLVSDAYEGGLMSTAHTNGIVVVR